VKQKVNIRKRGAPDSRRFLASTRIIFRAGPGLITKQPSSGYWAIDAGAEVFFSFLRFVFTLFSFRKSIYLLILEAPGFKSPYFLFL
jgi:hypothetical protein